MAIHSVELWLKGLAAVWVSPISVAQTLVHSSTQTVPRYAQVVDQNCLDAMRKLETLRHSLIFDRSNQESGHPIVSSLARSGDLSRAICASKTRSAHAEPRQGRMLKDGGVD
jgi:hypothetical protein